MSVEFGPVHMLPPEELEPASLLDTTLRVWAEVGRTRMPAASVVGMSEGAIVDLDVESHEPADLYVNGRHFGTGRLILVDGEWALRVESLDDDSQDTDTVADAEQEGAVEHVSTRVQGDPDPSD
jgi:flagellar motor switch/type III secretory pathway protein FliN